MNEEIARRVISLRSYNVMGGIGEPSSVITGEMSKLNDEEMLL